VRATLLFTDIVGSTRLAVEMGDLAWRDALERHDRIVHCEVERAGGRVVKNLGDGHLIAFDDAEAAVNGAHALVVAARAVGFEIRAGMHTGEVQVIGDDLIGINVHIAARVSSLADGGRVLATTAVVLAAGADAAEFDDRGMQTLRDVPGEFRLWTMEPVADRTAEPVRVAAQAS
jgi:class 3 adenylate cyclase